MSPEFLRPDTFLCIEDKKMLEKDIENLIAMYPEEFFPKSGFKLIGQQEMLGKCRADLIFEDKYDRKIIVEVKRGILTREASGQILEYYGLLKEQIGDDKTIELILCANIIPQEKRTFLERVGIECKELGLVFIQEISKKYNYKFMDENETQIKKQEKEKEKKIGSSREEIGVWLFQANPERYDIISALSDKNLEKQCFLVNQYKDEIKKNHIALIWMSGKDAGIYAITEIISDPEIRNDFPQEEQYWSDEKDKEKNLLRVVVEIKQNLIKNPLLKKEMKEVKELENLSIFKFSQGTNFPITDIEWEIIRKKINENLP